MKVFHRWLSGAGKVLRRIIGAPDYETYLAHMGRRHPEQPTLSYAEFARASMVDRYNRPGSRCC